jgi:capsular exopolysaccharide synthesis family protein
MSRVHDALRQAQDLPAETTAENRSSRESATRLADAALEQYPFETTGPILRAEGHGSPVRAASAPRALANEPRLLPPAAPGKLVTGAGADPICVEQYRRLAGVLHELQLDKGLKSLLVTSAVPGEGKTFTVSNLALTLSESFKRRVLLIDADLRRPSVHEVFRLPNKAGLSDMLRSEASGLPMLQLSKNLSVLPAGSLDRNPMAALTSARMRRLLEDAAASWDWVLLDAAPVGLMPDARLLAGLTRAVLFVIAAGSTPYPLIARALADLGPECIVGTVLNRIEAQRIPATSYYQQYYSGPVA